MSDNAEHYEYALNGAYALHEDGFWTATTQADEIELAKWVNAFRAVGLDEEAKLLNGYLETDAVALEQWMSGQLGEGEFRPSRDYDAELEAMHGPAGYAAVKPILERFRLLHGLEKL